MVILKKSSYAPLDFWEKVPKTAFSKMATIGFIFYLWSYFDKQKVNFD